MADNENYDVVKADFDEIAELSEPKWNHNNCYFDYLVSLIPSRVSNILDIGCGKGELSVKLSAKGTHVIAVDLSEKMIESAKRTNSKDNIEYICANILDYPVEDNSLDVIITTATAHHLPYEWLLNFASDKLKSNGQLIILDLVKAASLSDYLLWWVVAPMPNVIMNILKNGRLHKDDAHTKDVWEKHGKHDTYMTMKEIRSAAAGPYLNAKIKRKLFWRYILIWKKMSAFRTFFLLA